MITELLHYIYTFLEPKDLITARQINRQYYNVVTNPYLIKQFPSVMIKGKIYLKEEAYHKEALLQEIWKEDDIDLGWLVARITPLFKSKRSIVWCFVIDTAWDAAWNAVWNAASNAAWNAASNAAWDAARHAAMNAAWNAGWNTVWYTAWYAVKHSSNRLNTEIIEYIKELGILEPNKIGQKTFQIAECLALLSINEDLCQKTETILLEHNLLHLDLIIPNEKLQELQDNPWIQQYKTLYC
jgi:hypothetical protein